MKGLVIGKFMPLHNGHMKLIEFALDHCDELQIALVTKPCDQISVSTRLSWLDWVKSQYDKPIVVRVVDEPLPRTATLEQEAAQVWIDYFAAEFKETDRVFSSEQYGHMLAEAMGISHYFYDEARLTTQVSGSAIRNNPEKHLCFLPDPVRAYYEGKHRIEVFKVASPGLAETSKTVRVYLPPGYDLNQEQYYPVLYMHDGQNLFDPETSSYGSIWDVQGAVKTLSDANPGWPGLIVVGVDCAPGLGRLNEYSPWVSEQVKALKDFGDIKEPIGGLGATYGEFLVMRLKPLIDQRFRTLKDRSATGIGGSSMGGFISLYLGAKYPHVFSKVVALSTAAWFEEEAINECLARLDRRDLKWYLSIGTHETSNDAMADFNQLYLRGSLRLAETIGLKCQSDEDLMFIVDEGAIHHETAWAKRLPEAIQYLFIES